MERTLEEKIVTFRNPTDETVSEEVETFTQEKLDYIPQIKAAFKLS